jgi:hypothetical protein
MADISKCSGTNCPLKESCYRFLAKPSQMQSYFMEVPYNNESNDCDFYWDREVMHPTKRRVLSIDELKDVIIGPKGTKRRDNFDEELQQVKDGGTCE